MPNDTQDPQKVEQKQLDVVKQLMTRRVAAQERVNTLNEELKVMKKVRNKAVESLEAAEEELRVALLGS